MAARWLPRRQSPDRHFELAAVPLDGQSSPCSWMGSRVRRPTIWRLLPGWEPVVGHGAGGAYRHQGCGRSEVGDLRRVGGELGELGPGDLALRAPLDRPDERVLVGGPGAVSYTHLRAH